MKRRKQNVEGEDNNQQLYEPDKILDKKKESGRFFYLVKWKGYSAAQSTWEQYKSISHCNWLFEEWEEKQQKMMQKQLKFMDQIIDKSTQLDLEMIKKILGIEERQQCQIILIKFLNMKVNFKYFQRINMKLLLFQENEGLLIKNEKRKYKPRRYKNKEDRHASSNEDSSSQSQSEESSDENDNESQERESDDNQKNEKRKQRGRYQRKGKRGRINNSRQTEENKESEDDDEEQSQSDNDDDGEEEDSQTRRVVQAKRRGNKKILYDKLPFYGILGIDEPKKIKNMVIDKNVGQKDDGYFACDIVWKIRPNKQQPVDSRVSRKDIKEFYPLILIDFYEFNMTYNGDVVNADEVNEDDLDDEEYYQKQQRKSKQHNDESEDDDNGEQESDSKSNDSFFYTNHIYYGYAKTNEQKKFVKFDEKLFNNNQMEEM